MVELFAGTHAMADAFARLGWDTFTVDNDPDLEGIDLCVDICDLMPSDLPQNASYIHASPPCELWSYASGAKAPFAARNLNDSAYTEKRQQAALPIKAALRIILAQNELDHWTLENPAHGALQESRLMAGYPHVTIPYCQYGSPYQKRSIFWGKFPILWLPRTVCHHMGHPNMKESFHSRELTALERAAIPRELCDEIAQCAEDSAGRTSWTPLERWS
tara:strand:+ start:2262 stop:2915 length:654 start_codon:yes stop_codon:yes gene_type:complete